MKCENERRQRIGLCNDLIRVIASCGREFFRYGDVVAHLELNERGRVWFIDEYTCKRVYTHYHGRWRGFSGGGMTMEIVREAAKPLTEVLR
jgi:hypothetical protein